MSNGGYKGASPARETSPEHYPGVWELTEQFQAQADGNWPFQETDCAPKSLRFNHSDAAHLSKAFASAGNRQSWTWSGWAKRSKFSSTRQVLFSGGVSASNTDWLEFGYEADSFYWTTNNNTSYSTAKFRDPSAWHHVVVTYNGSYLKWYSNGVEAHSVSKTGDLGINGAWNHAIGKSSVVSGRDFDGYLAEVNFIDGQVLEPTDFAFYDGQGLWMPKRFTGDYSSGPDWNNFISGTQYSTGRSLDMTFDGLDNTYSAAAAGQTLTFAPVPAITGLTKVKLRVYKDSAATTDITLNGNVITSSFTAGQYTDAEFAVNNLTELTWTTNSSSMWIGVSQIFVERGGVYELLTPPLVGRNSFKLDFSVGVKDQSGLGNDWTPNNIEADAIGGLVQDWESMLTGAHDTNHGWGTTYGSDNMFDGALNTYTIGQANATGLTFTPTSPLGASATTIRIYGMDDNCPDSHLKINGVNYGGLVNSGTTWTVLKGTGAVGSGITSITSIYLRDNSAGNQSYRFAALEIDGVIITQGSTADLFVDSPVNGNEASTGAGGERRGNYCTLNPLSNGGFTMSNGNLSGSSQSQAACLGTIAYPKSGKWYYEISYESVPGYNHSGIATGSTTLTGLPGYDVNTQFTYWQNGSKTNNVAYGASFAANDVIGVAFDADAGSLVFYKNGVSQGVNATGLTTDTYFPYISAWSYVSHVNFGQRPFSHPVTGYSPLATSFLPEPSESAKHPHKGVDVALFNANNGVSLSIPLSFSQDLVWTKSRAGNYEPQIFDKVRGDDQEMSTNVARASRNLSGSFTFNDDGFTLPRSNNNANFGTGASMAWAWDAGESTTTIAAGGLNSSLYNQSQTWSNQVSGTQNSTYPFSNVFNADNMATHAYPANGTEAVFTPSPSFSNATTVTIWYYAPTLHANAFKLNGIGVGNSLSATSGTNTHTFDVTGFTSLSWSKGVYGSEDTGLLRIDVDGVQLVDNGVSVTNVPSIATTVRANPSYGFSISKASVAASLTGGPTVAHGLQKKPEFIIGKNIDSTIYWYAYHKDLTNEHYLIPHLTSGEQNSNAVWGNHDSLDANQIQIGAGTPASMWIPSGTHDCIFYAWTSIEGFSKIGSFINPSSSDGAFVFLGFKPALIFAKCAINISSSNNLGDWVVKDSSRSPFNNPSDGNTLIWNEAYAEDGYYSASQVAIDILSNGFKIRHPGSSPLGDPGRRYVFAAWAENPFASNNRAV